jgi:hypothetical protein
MNIPSLAWYHQSIFEGTAYAWAVEGHRACGSPKAATPPARAAVFIRERRLSESEGMARLQVSGRQDIGWIYRGPVMTASTAGTFLAQQTWIFKWLGQFMIPRHHSLTLGAGTIDRIY